MNIFQKYILKKASQISKQIEKKEKDRQVKLVLEKDASQESERLFIQTCKTAIWVELDKIISRRKANQEKECHLKIGDTAVADKYQLGRKSVNGWDGGIESLLQFIPKEISPSGLIVEITDVYLDTSLTEHRVDKFFDLFSVKDLNKNPNAFEFIWAKYVNWQDTQDTSSITRVWDRFGMYWGVKFETQQELTKFQPKWGLNINCFIAQGQLGYNETLDIALREHQITIVKRNADKKEYELKNEILKIKRELDNKWLQERSSTN